MVKRISVLVVSVLLVSILIVSSTAIAKDAKTAKVKFTPKTVELKLTPNHLWVGYCLFWVRKMLY